ncbi:MAG TPA: sigma-70 family RNA polymerase sigma factor [bacterium]|nr:sigma-70 family RNA polymerase sigma factor [bacterium]
MTATNPGLTLSKRQGDDAAIIAMVAAAQRGDREAFNALVRRYQQEVFGISLHFFRDRDEALDATQDVFLQVYRKLDQFRGDAKFGTWLYRVTVNTCRNRYASAQSRRKHEVVLTNGPDEDNGNGEDPLARLPSPEPTPENIAMDGDLSREIDAALAQLPESQRMMILLCDYRDFSYEEIAAAMECSLSVVKTGIHRGRLKLRELLRPLMQDGTL